MTVSRELASNWQVRNMDRQAIEDIRDLAIKHHVPIAEVLAQAFYEFESQLNKRKELPEGWRRPRGW